MKPKVQTKPVVTRFDPELMSRVVSASETMKLSQQDTLRLCVEIGLRDLETVSADIPAIVVEAARAKRGKA